MRSALGTQFERFFSPLHEMASLYEQNININANQI